METDVNLSFECIINSGCIYIERFEEGIIKYPYNILTGTETELSGLLFALYDENGPVNSFVDFYYHRLKPEEQEKLSRVLSQDQIMYIKKITKNATTVFYQLTRELLEITALLNAKEMLFSTYYFSKIPCTVWGNYERKYPIFYKDEEVREKIEGIISCKRKNMDYLHQ